MIELRFRIDLYSPSAVEIAVEAFSDYVEIERQRVDDVEIVRVTAADQAEERTLAAELANYALGATVDGLTTGGGEATAS